MKKQHSIWNKQLAGVLAMLICTTLATYAGGGARGGGGGGGGGARGGGGGGGFGGGGFGGAAGGGGGGGGARGGAAANSANTYGTATFSVDPNTHQIIVNSDAETYAQIQEVIKRLDIQKSQVLIKVVFMEVQHSDSSEIGLNATYTGQNSALSSFSKVVTNLTVVGGVPVTSYANQLVPNISAAQNLGSAAASGASGIYSVIGTDFTATLNAIAQNGKAELLSRPSILVRDGQPAQIHVGQSVPLITGVSYTQSGNTTVPILTPSYTSVGIQLDVTPFIAANNNVEMIVVPSISSVDPTFRQTIAEGVSVPALNVRSADTVVITPDGQTIVIGGLMEDNKASSESKVPFLGDIPFFGNLFKDKKKSSGKSELVIFLTPHIVRGPTQLAAMTDREHQEMISPQSFSEQVLDQFLNGLPKLKKK